MDASTYENLIGTNGQLIHPDSLVFTNTRGDTLYYEPYYFSDGWTTITFFGVYQEINFFNQCLLDSAFSLYYYVYLGHGDTDTIEVHFPAHQSFETTFYNGLSGEVPDDIADSLGDERSMFWFQKIIN